MMPKKMMPKKMRKQSVALALCLVLAACAAPSKKATEEKIILKKTSFAKLPGWDKDALDQVLPALSKSCARIQGRGAADKFGLLGTYGDWQVACRALPSDPVQARAFFEQNFTPYEIHGNDREGLFTGYYEPRLTAATSGGTPLYARPSNMFTADLGDFVPELKGKTITGRVEGEKFVPYYTREQIEKGAIKGAAEEIIRVDDPVDAFFLQIQGSGQVRRADGSVLHVGYAAQNGLKYEAIGKELIARGELTKENTSMQTIRAWLEAHPQEAQALMNTNPSYVFFREIGADGPLGAEGVALTPGRSLAVDRAKLPYGTPVFVDAAAPEAAGKNEGPRFQRLMVAQDTGGAIRGAVRGDVFWGAGEDAAFKAGVMKSPGYGYVLLPNTATPDKSVLR